MPTVGKAFEATRKRLAEAGARLSDFRTSRLTEMQAANAKGGFSPAEALSIHGAYFDTRKARFRSARVATHRRGARHVG